MDPCSNWSWKARYHGTRGLGQLAVFALLGLLCVAGCSSQATRPQTGGPPAPREWLLTFAPTVSYNQALVEVTDYGFQVGRNCGPQYVIGVYTYTTLWQPQGQLASYAATHQLYVE